MGGGLPYTILYEEEPWDCGVILSLGKAVRNKSTQEQSVSKIHLEGVSLSVRLVPSTIPELWGLYVVCNFHLRFKVLLTCYSYESRAIVQSNAGRKPKSGNYLPKQAPGYF